MIYNHRIDSYYNHQPLTSYYNRHSNNYTDSYNVNHAWSQLQNPLGKLQWAEPGSVRNVLLNPHYAKKTVHVFIILYDDFINQIFIQPFPNKRSPITCALSGWEKTQNDEVLVQRARLRKGRLERNARVNDLSGRFCRMVVVTMTWKFMGVFVNWYITLYNYLLYIYI